MRTLMVAFSVVALVACTQTTAVSTAGLGGSHDVAVHGRFVFVTSADKNELRVLDTAPPGINGKVFLRGPNPLETLSIPVVPGANSLAQDIGLAGAGELAPDGGVREVGSFVEGHFVFASQPGLSAISIVTANPSVTRPGGVIGAEPVFREIRRLPTAAPVMATAGWLTPEKKSRLYFATFDGSASAVFSLELGDATASLAATPKRVTGLPQEAVSALAVIAPLAARTLDGVPFCQLNECLVFSTRRMQGRAGRTLMVDPLSLKSAELLFPGPVRSLTVAPQVTFRLQGDPESMPDRLALASGERIFATLDEEQCGGWQCGGVVAVDTRTGAGSAFSLANDSTGRPMRPLSVGSSLITGLSVAPRVNVLLPASLTAEGTAGIGNMPLLGVVTSSNGSVMYFDALNLNQLDTDSAGPVVTGAGLYDAEGNALDYVGGPVVSNGDGTSAVSLGDGAWLSQQVIVANQGAVPGARDLPAQAGLMQALPEGISTRLRVGDQARFTTPTGVCTSDITMVSDTAITVSAGCPGARLFSVYAGATDPLVVQGGLAGFLGRSRPGATLTVNRDPLFRPPGQGAAPAVLQLQFGAAQVAAGAFWALDIDAHYAPYVVRVDGANINCSSSALQFPVRVTWSADRQRFYMLYPSGNALMELNTGLSIPGADLRLETGMVCYR